jgi:hypothetical protein
LCEINVEDGRENGKCLLREREREREREKRRKRKGFMFSEWIFE